MVLNTNIKMKKHSGLSKKQLLLGSIVIGSLPLIGFVFYFVFFFDNDLDSNIAKIDREINADSLIKVEIGYISRFDHNIEIIEKKENNKIEYVKMFARGGKGYYGLIEYWINKQDSIWKLDSINLLYKSEKYKNFKK
jgi:hypothetical protein